MTATKTAATVVALARRCAAQAARAASTFTMIVAARPVKDHVDRQPFEQG
jgi:hypothetical protein